MPRVGQIWSYFNIIDENAKKAVCNYCKKVFSYKTTVTNLKHHLKQKHIVIFEEMCGSGSTTTRNNNNDVVRENTDDESEDESKLSEIRSFFERETGGRARCLICRESVPNHHADLSRHLEQHPKLLAEQQDSDAQIQNDDDQETYTEVVYLEDAAPKETKKTEKKIWLNDTPAKKWRINKSTPKTFTKRRQKHRQQSSSSDEPVIKKNKEDDEIRKFGEYIICLLQKLPRAVCMKMQMNIVNMIMNANLASTSTEPVPIVQPVPASAPLVQSQSGTVPVTIQPIPPGYYVLGKSATEKALLQNTSETDPVTSNLDGNHSYSVTIAPSPAAITTVANNENDSDKQNEYTLNTSENGA